MKPSAYFLHLLLETKSGKSCLLENILKSEELQRSNYTHFLCYLLLDLNIYTNYHHFGCFTSKKSHKAQLLHGFC